MPMMQRLQKFTLCGTKENITQKDIWKEMGTGSRPSPLCVQQQNIL